MIQSQEHQQDVDYTGQYGNHKALGDLEGAMPHNQPASTASDAKVTNSSRQSFQIPGFLNNHIENLTINAPPGFEMPAQAQLEASQTREREDNTMNNGTPFVSTPTAAIRP